MKYPRPDILEAGGWRRRSHDGINDPVAMQRLLAWLEGEWIAHADTLSNSLVAPATFEGWVLALAQALVDAIEQGALNPQQAGRATELPSLTGLLQQPWAQVEHLEVMLWVAWMWSRGQKRKAKPKFLKVERDRTGLTVTALRTMLERADTALTSFQPRSALWPSAAAPLLILFVESDRARVTTLATVLGKIAPGRAIRTEHVWPALLPRVADLFVQAGDFTVFLWSAAARAQLALTAGAGFEAIHRRRGLIAIAHEGGVEPPDWSFVHAVVDLTDVAAASVELARVLDADEAARTATGRRVVRCTPAGTGERIYVTAERFHRTVALDVDLSMPTRGLIDVVIDALALPREHVVGGTRIASYDYALFLDEQPLDAETRFDQQGGRPGVTLDLFIGPRLFPDGPPPVPLPNGFVRHAEDRVPATEDEARERAEVHLRRALRSMGIAS